MKKESDFPPDNVKNEVSEKTQGIENDNKTPLEIEIEEFLENFLPDNTQFGSNKVIHDGLWGTLKLNPCEICIIDTPLLQRLRQIHQTGCSYLIFPSTTHTRFEHTLGVMRKIDRLGEAIIKADPDEKRINQDDINDMRLGALLHDVGHGFYSHTSEEIYGSLPQI